MSAFSNKKKTENPSEEKPNQMLGETPEEILRRKRAIESRVGDTVASGDELTDMAAEKAVGALCFLPKSIYRLATRYAEDKDLTAKRFFLETLLLGLEQQGVITSEQRTDCLSLPPEYGWKGRSNKAKE